MSEHLLPQEEGFVVLDDVRVPLRLLDLVESRDMTPWRVAAVADLFESADDYYGALAAMHRGLSGHGLIDQRIDWAMARWELIEKNPPSSA